MEGCGRVFTGESTLKIFIFIIYILHILPGVVRSLLVYYLLHNSEWHVNNLSVFWIFCVNLIKTKTFHYH